eukprot:UN11756
MLLDSDIIDDCQGIIHAYRPGPKGGEAIYNILTGETNPSGTLPFSIPNSDVYKAYWNLGNDSIFSFGDGLSYSTFTYSKVALSTDEIEADEKMGG